jgi:nucleotide-binding universal stress UspA family protein
MTQIVVGVDGSPNAAAALRWAVAEARRRGVHLLALFAWGYVQPGHAGDDHTFDPSYDAGRAETVLAAAVEAALGPDAAGLVERSVPHDTAARALLEAAVDAELLVVGARGTGGLHGLLLGSVSRELLHRTIGPLAIVRSMTRAGAPEDVSAAPASRIVVGVDDSASARRALHWAADEARLRGVPLDVVRAWHVLYPVAAPVAGYPVEVDAMESTARTGLDRALAALRADELPGPTTGRLVEGPAGPAIVEAARGADLVVLGTRGHGAVAGALLGSVTHHVARHSSGPVVVVP